MANNNNRPKLSDDASADQTTRDATTARERRAEQRRQHPDAPPEAFSESNEALGRDDPLENMPARAGNRQGREDALQRDREFHGAFQRREDFVEGDLTGPQQAEIEARAGRAPQRVLADQMPGNSMFDNQGRPYSRTSIGPRVGMPLDPNDRDEWDTPMDRDALVPEDEGDDDMMLLNFPREVNLQHGGMMHHFPRGENIRARKSLVMVKKNKDDKDEDAELHWYLRHNGVRPPRKNDRQDQVQRDQNQPGRQSFPTDLNPRTNPSGFSDPNDPSDPARDRLGNRLGTSGEVASERPNAPYTPPSNDPDRR